MKNFILGIRCHVKAFRFLVKHKFWWYSLVPFFVFIGIYALGFYLKGLEENNSPDNFDDFEDVKKMLYYFYYGILLLLFLSLTNFTRYIVIILISPVLAIISQRTEKILTGNTYKFDFKQLKKDIIRAINLAFRNIIYEFSLILLITVLFWFISLFISAEKDMISFIKKGIIMIIAFYYYGFAFLDYTLERMRLSVEESIIYVRKKRGLAISIGVIFTTIFHYSQELLNPKDYFQNDYVFYLTIFAIALISSIVPVWSMIASTIALNEIEGLENNKYANKEID